MKVSLDLKKDSIKNNSTVAFGGYKPVKSEEGFKELEFAYPYDKDAYECYLKIYKVGKDKKGNYFVYDKAYTRDGREGIFVPHDGSKRIDFQNEFGFSQNQPFAYHYYLKGKNGHNSETRTEAGDLINQDGTEYNIVSSVKSGLSKGGAMKLVIIDSQNVGYVYNDQNVVVKDERLAKRGQEGIKTLTNKFGGTLAGLEHGIDKGDYDYYRRIISLPLFTDDDFTGHSYWNKNCMQMVNSLGNINQYASLQRKMFAHGLNFVSDGAFVNEGLEGTHFGDVLKWGEDSPYYYWFRASGLKDGPLSLGVFSKNKDFISHKIVNSPNLYTVKPSGRISITSNPKYDSSKPTYIQFFDTRLVTEDERNDNTSLIKTYSRMSTPNVYDLHSHQDSIFPYYFEINPDIYDKNVRNLNDYNSRNPEKEIDIKSPKAARLLSKSENYVVDGKFESGFETWDANVDIAKLNFVFSNTDALYLKNLPEEQRDAEMAKMVRGNLQVQDYAVTSGQYWTQKTDDILRLHIARTLRNVDLENPSLVYNNIMDLSNNQVFPEELKTELTKEEVKNVLEDMYNHKRILSNAPKNEQILEGVMNTHLDAIEFGSNLTAVLASPLITKRANTESEIGVSRYDIYKNGNANLPKEYEKTYKKMDEIFKNDLASIAQKVLNQVDGMLSDSQKLFKGDEVTEYGKYVLPLVLPEITKYAVVKALAPKVTVKTDRNTGELSYDYNAMKNVHIQSFGITNYTSPQDEAQVVLKELQNGLKNVDTGKDGEIVESIFKTLRDTNLTSFQLADLIIDKTQAGLDWRIDATKDIADVEALRNGQENFDTIWSTVINFWKRFVDGVQSKNPNAYTVAELTNEIDLHDAGYGGQSRFPGYNDIIPKFLRETGMSSMADYKFFFRPVSKAFSNDFEDGSKFGSTTYASKMIDEKIHEGLLRIGGLDSIMYLYTFIGNHDKPRALHCAALDMGLFYSDLTFDDINHRRTAYKILNDKFFENVSDNEVNNFDYSGVSPKAIAMADAIRPGFMNVLNTYKGKMPPREFNAALEAISKSISDLASGNFMGHRFDPDAFGIKPIDVAISSVLQQAKEKHGLNLPKEIDKDYEDKVFEAVMTPALSKVLAMMSYLVALPGMPTLFDGDDAGATGWDPKTKNMYLQGRQRVHDEWITQGSPKYKEFLAKYKTDFDKIMGIRSNPKCNALNNGAVFALPLNKVKDRPEDNKVEVASVLRQSTDGRMAISIFNPEGIPADKSVKYNPQEIVLSDFVLNNPGDKSGIMGLTEGTEFVNPLDPDGDHYYTRVKDGKYTLVRHYDGKHDGNIKLKEPVLILYSLPKKNIPLTFTGSCKVPPTSGFVANAYSSKVCENGKKLALVSE